MSLFDGAPTKGFVIVQPHGMVSSVKSYPVEGTFRWENRVGLSSMIRLIGEFGPGLDAEMTFKSGDGLHKYELVAEHIASDSRRISKELRTFEHRFELVARAWKSADIPVQADIDKVQFELLNFPQFYWIDGPSSCHDAPITCVFGSWELTIQASLLPENAHRKADRAQSRRQRGYVVTNSAQLTRVGGAAFKLSEWESLSDFLFYLFSFCAGLRCPPVNITALRSGTEIWKDWSLSRVGHDRPHNTWFPEGYPHLIATVFDRAWARQADPDKWEATKRAIEWYLEPVDRELDAEKRVIGGQLALELLSWVVLVEERARFTKTQFRKMDAKTYFEELCKEISAPDSIPSLFGLLISDATTNAWINAPACLADIRNKLIHPKKSNRLVAGNIDPESMHEAADWATWMTELVLLNLFNYQGVFTDRSGHWSDEFPTVPWAPSWSKPDEVP